jgi:hypothetical protein
VELAVTMFLLILFASLAFPIFWGTAKADTAHAVESAAQAARLSLAAYLPRLAEEVRPPYWENPEKVFQGSGGTELKAFYRDGAADGTLVFRKEGDARLAIVSSDSTLFIDNLPDLALDWWKKDDRIIGVTVQWKQQEKIMEFHASWGSFIL